MFYKGEKNEQLELTYFTKMKKSLFAMLTRDG